MEVHRLMVNWGEFDVVQMSCFLSLSLSLNSTFAEPSKVSDDGS